MSSPVDERSPPLVTPGPSWPSARARSRALRTVTVLLTGLLAWTSAAPARAQLRGEGAAGVVSNTSDPESTQIGSPPTLVDIDDIAVTPKEPGAAAVAEGVHQRVAELDKELEELQHDTRLYLGGWLAANIGMSGAQLAVALTTERPEIRGNYYVGAALSLAGIGVLLAQPWPGLKAHKKYRAIKTSTTQEEVLKIARGEEMIRRQRNWDHIAVLPDKHIAAGVISLASGLGVGFGFHSLKEGLSRALGVLFVLELQILTRPGTYFAPKGEPGKKDRPYLAFAPWIDRYSQGATLMTVF